MKTPSNDFLNKTLMLSGRDVAKLLQCSDRHVSNLWKQGRMPLPAKLGTLVRWPRHVIEEWIERGCPTIAETPSKGAAAIRPGQQPTSRMNKCEL
jgi:excisionase family DNA binding protein